MDDGRGSRPPHADGPLRRTEQLSLDVGVEPPPGRADQRTDQRADQRTDRGTDEPEEAARVAPFRVEVIRSKRRTRSVGAHLGGDTLRLAGPFDLVDGEIGVGQRRIRRQRARRHQGRAVYLGRNAQHQLAAGGLDVLMGSRPLSAHSFR